MVNIAELATQIDRVERVLWDVAELHEPDRVRVCRCCLEKWPCATRKLVETVLGED